MRISRQKVVSKIEKSNESLVTRVRWSSKEDRELWEVRERCLLDGDGNLRQRIWEEWNALGRRKSRLRH